MKMCAITGNLHVKAICVSFFLVISLALSGLARPKQIKPMLLVYGSTTEAFAAAIQSARSNVPTLWITDGPALISSLPQTQFSVRSNDNLNGGVWMDMLMQLAQSKSKSDSLANAIKADINPQLMMNAMEQMVTNEKNLTVIKDKRIDKLTRGKKDWTAVLSDKRKYTIRAVIDASEDGKLHIFSEKSKLYKPGRVRTITQLSVDELRTLVGIAGYDGQTYVYSIADLISRNDNNLFMAQSLIQVPRTAESLPLSICVGQALGAAAGYCSFFKTTAEKIDMRKLQAELMAFDARLMPDIGLKREDPNFKSIQSVYLTGLFSLTVESDSALRLGHYVAIEEVKPLFNQLYSRSQLWFVDHPSGIFTVGAALDFIKFISFKGIEVDKEIEKDWYKKLKFQQEYDADREISLYEFAILLDRYADPFSKRVTLDGTIVR